MKKFLSLLLIICLMLPLFSAYAAPEALYKTNAESSSSIYTEPDKESKSVGRVYNGSAVKVYSLTPGWAYISCSGKYGYVPRTCLEEGDPIDKNTTPPWGVEFHEYVGTVGKKGVTIYAAPDRKSETLISLTEGAKISIIGFENGWAKLPFKRQYGYVDTNQLSELLPVCPDAFSGTDEAPIATFTTYYYADMDDDKFEGGKEINIEVNCGQINGDILEPGKKLDYNNDYGPFSRSKGYVKGPVYIETGKGLGYGGGVCQVSSTMYNLLLQVPGVTITLRRSHGPSSAEYLPVDMDAAVGNEDKGINLIYRNDYDFPVRFEAHAQDGALFLAVYRVTE
ncbi:MAG: VanW family protein [Clostridia bacterium]|nr:VanW family protein [Clostridia bacterium]